MTTQLEIVTSVPSMSNARLLAGERTRLAAPHNMASRRRRRGATRMSFPRTDG
jgi:hypothetical protein